MSPPARWLVLTVRPGGHDETGLLADALVELGGGAVLEEGGALTTYLVPPEDAESFVRGVERTLGELSPASAPRVTWRWQRDEDWAARWKEGLAPRRVGGRLVVKPTWTEWHAAPGEVVVDVDPQMAFGTGEHATTRSCLRLLEGGLRPGDRVLDVGSGSAILAIAAALLGAREVVAVEYDPDANLNARENLERNRVADRVTIVEAMAEPRLMEGLGTFDLVLANILSSVIRPLLPALRDTLAGAPTGRLIVSGILLEEAAEVRAAAAEAGFRIVKVDEEEEWWTALLSPTPA
jgi:ribosomal protein L11 methyltransferase